MVPGYEQGKLPLINSSHFVAVSTTPELSLHITIGVLIRGLGRQPSRLGAEPIEYVYSWT